ncbi:uncharacterized protein LOC115091685 [Rhinatrema bivittatum]|uniref:uncharacterized protein LOC115091685 n=1 Tax=Rhinatrema bivittatum TaxID=194408 RepID=UPI001125B9DC|nr:uncharacterized protein LOC115091685 [Rhinatrema bivittatum]
MGILSSMFYLLKLDMIFYLIGMTVSYESEISVVQHPHEITASVGATICIICEFDYADQTVTHTDVYWIKGSTCKQAVIKPSLLHIHMRKSISKKYAILQLEHLQPEDSGTYFCEVSLPLPPPRRHQCANGTTLMVNDTICNIETASENTSWWLELLLLVYSVGLTTICAVFTIHHWCKKCKNSAMNEDRIHNPQILLEQDTSIRTMNNILYQEYEDMTFLRKLSQNGNNI